MRRQYARTLAVHLVTLLAMLTTTAVPAQESTPAKPYWLGPYLSQGELTISNLRWGKTRFATDATQRELWDQAIEWMKQRKQQRTAEIRASLTQAGAPGTALEEACYGDESCQLLEDFDSLATKFPSWEALEEAEREARPYLEGYRYAVETASHIINSNPQASIADQLVAAKVLDQIYTIGIVGNPQRRTLPLSSQALEFFKFALSAESREQIRKNTAMLKAIVAREGWPKRSVVGEQAQGQAWLIVQHADHDPLFQYNALRLMEKLAAAGEASNAQTAYLYDRIMLKLSGKQRYGTQMTCLKGRWQPLPLEEPDQVDALRKTVDMPPFEDYVNRFPPGC